jgi:hypothetical protein
VNFSKPDQGSGKVKNYSNVSIEFCSLIYDWLYWKHCADYQLFKKRSYTHNDQAPGLCLD